MDKRKNTTQDLRSVIKDLLRQNNLENRFNEQEVIDSWPDIVGPLFAKYTSKIVMRNGMLYVTLNSSAARQELAMAKSHLINSINKRFNDKVVRDIVFY